MAGIQCKKCGAMMALSDRFCLQCGAEADPGQAAAFFLEKAESARLAENWAEASSQWRKALALPIPAADQAGLWYKLGFALDKLSAARGDERLGEEAAQAFQKSLEMDDSNDLAHQMWIANLARRGQVHLAISRYQKRLNENPGDARAEKFRTVASLSMQFKNSPVKVRLKGDKIDKKRGMLGLILNPSPMNLTIAIVSFIGSLVPAVYSLFRSHHASATSGSSLSKLGLDAGSQMAAGIDMGSMMNILNSPKALWISALTSGVYLALLWKARAKKR